MGRNVFKWTAPAIFFVFMLVGGAIVSQGLDGLAEEAGVKSIAAGLFRYLAALDLGNWLIVVGAFSGGIALCLHAEKFLRTMQNRRALHDCAQIRFSFDEDGYSNSYSEKSGTSFGMVVHGPLHGKIHESEPKTSRLTCTLLIVFDRPLRDPVAFVASDRRLIWRDVSSSDQYIVLEIDPRVKGEANVQVIVRPEKWANWGRWIPAPMQWQDSCEVEKGLLMDPIVPPRMRDWLFG